MKEAARNNDAHQKVEDSCEGGPVVAMMKLKIRREANTRQC